MPQFKSASVVERRRAQWRASYHKNKEKNRESIKERSVRYYSKNRELILLKNKTPKGRERFKRYRESNLQKCRESWRKYYYSDVESIRKYYRDKKRVAYEINPSSVLKSNRQWYKNNRGKRYSSLMKRKAIKRNATVNHSGVSKFMSEVLGKDSFCCRYCKTVYPISELHFDHIVPLSGVGCHSVENLCTACAKCNLKKVAKTDCFFNAFGEGCLVL